MSHVNLIHQITLFGPFYRKLNSKKRTVKMTAVGSLRQPKISAVLVFSEQMIQLNQINNQKFGLLSL